MLINQLMSQPSVIVLLPNRSINESYPFQLKAFLGKRKSQEGQTFMKENQGHIPITETEIVALSGTLD
jgi:hypothetical protein